MRTRWKEVELMIANELENLQHEIYTVTSNLCEVVNNSTSNLRNDSTLKLSEQLDVLIMSYMKKIWRAA